VSSLTVETGVKVRRSAASTALIARRGFVLAAMGAALVPFLWTLRVATRPPESYIGNPSGLGGGFTLHNFTVAWSTGGLGRSFVNSLLVAPLGALIATLLATLAAYALAKMRLPGRRLVLGYVVLTIGIPAPAIVIPLFSQGLTLGYVDHKPGLSLVYGGLFAAWCTYFLYNFFQSVPDALLDAARIDGASEWQVFGRVAIPSAKSAIAAVLVINLFATWSELLLALVMLPSASQHTVMVAVAQYNTEFRTGGPLAAAGMLIAALPILLVFLAGQRFLRAGAFAGAVKN
jgi:ABC-type glycerol-3-phosphate transport system permease component